MAKRQSMKDIAEAAGVSIATVSRVMNNKPDVNPRTRDLVMSVAEREQYEHRGGASPQTKLSVIGFVHQYRLVSLRTDYVAGLLEGCNARAADHGYNVILIEADQLNQEMRRTDRNGIISQLSGVIWAKPAFQRIHRDFLVSRDIPFVVINDIERGVEAPLVECDNYTAVRQGVEYLVGMGHRKIGFIGGELGVANFRDRYDGYRQHMREFGLEIDPDWVIDDVARVEQEGATESTYRLLGRRNLPTALICVTESVARGVYRVFADRGIRVPDDVSIIAFDDPPIAPHLHPPMTTFRQHVVTMGGRATDLLVDLIHDPARVETTHVRVPMTLIVRDSVGARPEGDDA